MTPEERAREILAPLFNPEPHPLRADWSDAHSMDSADLVGLLADAIRAARNEALEEAARVADKIWLDAQDTEWDRGGNSAKRSIAAAIRALKATTPSGSP